MESISSAGVTHITHKLDHHYRHNYHNYPPPSAITISNTITNTSITNNAIHHHCCYQPPTPVTTAIKYHLLPITSDLHHQSKSTGRGTTSPHPSRDVPTCSFRMLACLQDPGYRVDTLRRDRGVDYNQICKADLPINLIQAFL